MLRPLPSTGQGATGTGQGATGTGQGATGTGQGATSTGQAGIALFKRKAQFHVKSFIFNVLQNQLILNELILYTFGHTKREKNKNKSPR